MRVTYNGNTYNVRWPKRFDEIILKVAKKYKRAGSIAWKRAEADGMLKGLPAFLTLRDISQRNSLLKRSKEPGFKKKKYKQNAAYRQKNPTSSALGTIARRKLFAETLPEDLKKKHGWKPRGFWTKAQKELLLELAEEHRKSKVTIDWKSLGEDKAVKKLPFQDSFKLCKYYNSLKRKKKGGKKFVKRRREEALNYKYENYSTYRSNQDKQRIRVKNSVNEFLLSTLELR